jgi:hypothetical protein
MDFSEIKKKMSLIKVQAHDYLPWICNASIGLVLINGRMQVFILIQEECTTHIIQSMIRQHGNDPYQNSYFSG